MVIASAALLLSLARPAGPSPAQTPRADCREWHECRALALAAAERGEYETFHDLAWRAVQTGPPRDPALMLLLARAQALSGRPHDALVMLGRLADMGVAPDVERDEAFSRTRALPGWPDVAARLARARDAGAAPPEPAVAAPAAPTAPARASARRRTLGRPAEQAPARASRSGAAAAPTSAVTTPEPATPPSAAPLVSTPASPAAAVPPTTAPAPAALRAALAPVSEAVRFTAEPFAVADLAYDAVSRRFLFGDRRGRKLIVVGDGSQHASDLVRHDSAGFEDIAAIEIDRRRGDLWVASGAAAGGSATIHKLQLVSGRPLASFHVPDGRAPTAIADMGVAPDGTVLALDPANRRLLVLRPGTGSIEGLLQLEGGDPSSLAVSEDDDVLYVARSDGLSRIDLHTSTQKDVAPHGALSLAGFERIRAARRALVGVRRDADGVRRIVRLELGPGGRSVTNAAAIAEPPAGTGRVLMTISGDELLYVMDNSEGGVIVAYRVPLR